MAVTQSRTVAMRDLVGVWRRSSIVHRDGSRDTATQVRWVQGAVTYVDLRHPADRPKFGAVRGIRDLEPRHLRWMEGQLAFAGTLSVADGVFTWHKAVDLQPVEPDHGHLSFEGGVLVEHALDLAYSEHWHRSGGTLTPTAECRLVDPDSGQDLLVVRVGSTLGVARSRRVALPSGGTLADLLAAQPTLRDQQDLVDCAVDLAGTAGDRWRVNRSSHPWREGGHLHLTRYRDDRVVVGEWDIDGEPTARVWRVVSASGDLDSLWHPEVPLVR